MEFTELKMIWDSQNQEPLFALNETALLAVVRRRTEEIHRSISRCHLREIALGLIFGTLMLTCAGALAFGNAAWLATVSRIKNPVTPWDWLALFVAGGLWFYYSAYMYSARQRELRREEIFESTLRGAIERALDQTDFQIAMARSILWRGVLPLWLAGALWVLTVFHLVAAPAWAHVVMGSAIVGSFVFVVAAKQRAITTRYEPRRHELESLRAKLADSQP